MAFYQALLLGCKQNSIYVVPLFSMLLILPNELLVEVFSYLSSWEDFPKRMNKDDDDDAETEDEEVRNEDGADGVRDVEGTDVRSADDESSDEESEDDDEDERDYEDEVYEDTISFPRLNTPGITALAHLCRVSKGIRALAEPFLYQNFVKWPNYYADPTDPLESTLYNIHGTGRFRGFLSTIMQRPELAASVRGNRPVGVGQ